MARPNIKLYVLTEAGAPRALQGSLIATMLRWARWRAENDKRVQVGDTRVRGLRVSTVFLGIDHNHTGVGPPVLWETMVFGKSGAALGDIQHRYRSHSAALRGHAEMVRHVRAELGKRDLAAETVVDRVLDIISRGRRKT